MLIMKEVTILHAEDDLGHAHLVKSNLRRSGFNNDIVHFENGARLLDYLADDENSSASPFLVLLDIRMPEMDGFETIRRIKENPKHRLIPVIMLTTTDYPPDIYHSYQIGCSVYITKPVDYDSFTEAIKKLGLFLSIVEAPA